MKYPEAEYLKKIQAGDEKSTGNLTESIQNRNHLNRLAAGDDLGREYLKRRYGPKYTGVNPQED